MVRGQRDQTGEKAAPLCDRRRNERPGYAIRRALYATQRWRRGRRRTDGTASGERAGAAWGERLEAHLRDSRDLASQQADGTALIAHQREQRSLEILARLAGQAFLLERVARLVLQVAPDAQEARFLVGRTATGLGFVRLTTEAGRKLRWDRASLESAHELGEDWWTNLEDQFIDEAEAIPGDTVVVSLRTREVAYQSDRHATSGRGGSRLAATRDGR
jgi:hypothetical protein